MFEILLKQYENKENKKLMKNNSLLKVNKKTPKITKKAEMLEGILKKVNNKKKNDHN